MKNLPSPLALLLFLALGASLTCQAWRGMPMPQLKVQGRYLVDTHGKVVNLHGFAQTYSPWFNEMGTQWTNYDVEGCLRYNQEKIDQMLNAGWEMNMVRMHMDPYWSNLPGHSVQGEHDISAFSESRFRRYLTKVFIPMAQYAVDNGLYVVMRPPGVCPEEIAVGDDYQKYLLSVWEIVAKRQELKNHPNIMFELANEPVRILGPDGTYGSGTQGHFDNLKEYFQPIVDIIRAQGCDNILWVPGLGYQSQYAGYAKNPIQGKNIGYAVHIYPGWFGSANGYDVFKAGWDKDVKPVADFAPIMVTEMDWAPEEYNSSWGKGITGEAFGEGFGANFKQITDDSGNVSWILFTDCHKLAQFKDEPGTEGNYTFLNDPQACPWPIYHWYQEYKTQFPPHAQDHVFTAQEQTMVDMYSLESDLTILPGTNSSIRLYAIFEDGHEEPVEHLASYTSSNQSVATVKGGWVKTDEMGKTSITASYTDVFGNTLSEDINAEVTLFPLRHGFFNPSIWETGTFDENTKVFTTGQYGFAGWTYGSGVDLSQYKYCVAKIEGNANGTGLSMRLFDINNYWSSPAIADFKYNSDYAVIDLHNTKVNDKSRLLEPSHIYIAGFWTMGGKEICLKSVYVTKNDDYLNEDPAGVTMIYQDSANIQGSIYNIYGVKVMDSSTISDAQTKLPSGLYIHSDGTTSRKFIVR